MSNTIDSRVVEMKFDNKQFESAVQTSLNTLEKLKNDIQTLLKKDDTVKRLAENLFYRFISQKIDDMIWRNTTLQSLIQIQAGQMIDNKFNNK